MSTKTTKAVKTTDGGTANRTEAKTPEEGQRAQTPLEETPREVVCPKGCVPSEAVESLLLQFEGRIYELRSLVESSFDSATGKLFDLRAAFEKELEKVGADPSVLDQTIYLEKTGAEMSVLGGALDKCLCLLERDLEGSAAFISGHDVIVSCKEFFDQRAEPLYAPKGKKVYNLGYIGA